MELTCAIEGCVLPPKYRGWCNGHYRRWVRWGDPLGGRVKDGRRCTAPGCEAKHYGLGYCQVHYSKAKRRPHRKSTKACSACGGPYYARGWCKTHYRAWKRSGSPQRRRETLPERISRFVVESPNGCWEWNGSRFKTGYGKMRIDGRTVSVHRASYEAHVGPIPDGLQIDHLCRNRPCCNPAHLEPVTASENLRRAAAARRERVGT